MEFDHCWYCKKPIEPNQIHKFSNKMTDGMFVPAHKDCRIWVLERNEWLLEQDKKGWKG